MQRTRWRDRYLSDREGQAGEKYVGIATDGADFIAFFLRHGHVVEVAAHHTQPDKPRELLAWLQCAVAVGDGLLPDPETIKREFGRKSLAARRALDELSARWELAGQSPGGRLRNSINLRANGARGTSTSTFSICQSHCSIKATRSIVGWPRRAEWQKKLPVDWPKTRESTSRARADECAPRSKQTASPLFWRI